MPEANNHKHLPLHRLFLQLKEAGFVASPADRMRVQQLLSAHLHLLRTTEGRHNLMYLLAPLLCRNKAEQALFYRIYASYLETLETPLPVPEEQTPEPGRTPKPKALRWIIAAFVLALAGVTGYFIWKNAQPKYPKLAFNGPTEAHFGDSLNFVNRTPPADTAGILLVWQASGNSFFVTDTQPERFNLRIPDTLAKPAIAVRLSAYNRKTGEALGWTERRTTIRCENPPAPRQPIRISGEMKPGLPVRFRPPADTRPNWKTEWDFGDGQSATRREPQHTYDKEATYTVRLTLTDTLRGCYCDTTLELQAPIVARDTLPVLAELKLNYDPPAVHWYYAWWLWLLGLALLAPAAWFFWRWLRRPWTETEAPDAAEPPEALVKALEPADRAPYTIPFRSNNAAIRLAQEQLELANTLRLRQEGERHELHVPRSVAATVQKGGFPDLQFVRNTRPTDYLFLVDLQSEDSHLARLFLYLCEMLREQDVHFDLFFYRGAFGRVWNAAYPGGLDLEQLYFLRPDRRLVVFGDGYGLLNDAGPKRLHAGWSETLRKWKRRLLVTSVPLSSWTFKEARLYRLFPLFQADLHGLLKAAEYIEAGMEEEELPPTLNKWEERLRHAADKADTAHNWRSAADHATYLSEHPELFRWLLALSVYPEPGWNITIAIGRALGIPVTYQHLLLLARIPWLQSGGFRGGLWREFGAQLPKADELKARKAVKEELEAVQALSAEGFAHQKLQIRLAVQHFALEPQSEQAKAGIRLILERTSPSPMLLEELDHIVQRHTPLTKKTDDARGAAVRRYLEKPKLRQRPFATADWWRALACGLPALLLLGALLVVPPGYWQKKDWASPLLRRTEKATDEAQRLHNLGVTASRNPEMENVWGQQRKPNFAINQKTASKAAVYLDQAMQKRPNYDYPQAEANYARLWFNDGVKFLYKSPQDLFRAKTCFRMAALNDSLRRQAFEGLAIAHLAASEIDSACAWMDSVQAIDPTYVHYLRVRGECSPGQKLYDIAPAIRGRVVSSDGKPLAGVSVRGAGQDLLTDRKGSYTLRLPDTFPSDRILLRFSLINFETNEQLLTVHKVNTLPDVVLLKPLLPGVPDRDGDGVPDAFDLCPDSVGTVANKGCKETIANTKDTDQDGVADQLDKCPGEKGLIAYSGCPDAVSLLSKTEPNSQLILDAMKGFAFDDSPTVTEAEAARIQKWLGVRDGTVTRIPNNPDILLYGRFDSNHFISIWVNKDNRPDRYGVLLGEAPIKLPLNYNPDFEIVRPAQPPALVFPTMIPVKGGIFTMGCTNEQGSDCGNDEKPPHQVTLSDYAIGQTEVTNEQFAAFLNDYGSIKVKAGEYAGQEMIEDHQWGVKFPSQKSDGLYHPQNGYEKFPVVKVSWYGANEYCVWLTAKTGKKYRLPTEAEWEYAARGGQKKKADYKYAGSNDPGDVAWYDQNSNNQTHSVKQKQPNDLGLYDMTGNVWEWCADWYDDYPANPPKDYAGPASGSLRVGRGGSWGSAAGYCRVSDRDGYYPDGRGNGIGFRVAASPQ